MLKRTLLTAVLVCSLAIGWMNIAGLPIYVFFLLPLLLLTIYDDGISKNMAIFVVPYFILSLISLTHGVEYFSGLVSNLISGFSLAIVAYSYIRNVRNSLNHIILVVLSVQVVSVVLGLLQTLYGIGFFLPTQFVSDFDGHASPAGLSSMQYAFVRNFFPIISFVIAYFIVSKKHPNSLSKCYKLAICCGMVGFTGLMISNSRSAVISVIGAYILLLILTRRKESIIKSKSEWVFFAIFVVSLTMILVYKPIETDGELNYNSYSRIILWTASLDLFRENILFGIGSASDALNSYFSGGDESVVERMPHNIFLQLLVEVGLVGMLLYITPFALMLFKLLRIVNKARDPWDLILILTVCIYTCVFFADAFFHNHLNDNSYWIFLGIGFAALSRYKMIAKVNNNVDRNLKNTVSHSNFNR